jgi:hypothetical protein
MNWFPLRSRGNRATDGSARKDAQRKRPVLEGLEDRCLLSVGLDPNERFIQALYQDDMGRSGAVAEIDSWIPALVTNGLQAAVKGIEHSPEALTHLVDGFYAAFLGRSPVNGEEQNFVTQLENGATQESVASVILGSQEFFQHAPQINGVGSGSATNLTLIQGLFQVLLNRSPSADELNVFARTYLPRMGRQGVASLILGSLEYRNDVVKGFYVDGAPGSVLHRQNAPSAAEISTWSVSGLSLGQIHAAFEASLEKYYLGYTPLDANERFIQTIYQDSLGRTGSVGELSFWEQDLLINGQGAAVQGIDHSLEARTRLVDSWYVTFLGRNAAGGEEQGFVQALINGTPEEQVLGSILGSQEYFNRSPQFAGVSGNTPTDQTFVQALFQQLLNRAPNGDELNNLAQTVLPQQGRQGVTAYILGSPEFRTDVIGAFYGSILQRSRPPTALEATAWVNSGLGLWPIQVAFESSFEAFAVHPQIGAVGDSITDLYAKYVGKDSKGNPLWGSNGDRSWVEQLQTLRATSVGIDDVAQAGASSADLLIEGQQTSVAKLVQNGSVNYAVLIVGSGDIANFLSVAEAAGGTADPTPFITSLVTNVQTVLDALHAAGNVNVVIANVPDIGQTPQFQAQIGTNKALATLVTTAVISANQRLEAFAASRGIPVVDLYKLEGLSQSGLVVDGQTVANFFAPDGYNPGSAVQGLLANSILQAAHDAYGLNIAGLRLSDQEILQPNTPPTDQLTYTDVSSYVVYNATTQPPPFLTIFAMG